MKRLVAFAVLGLIAAASAAGQAQKVTYLDGVVETQAGSAWRPLLVGETVGVDAKIRLGAGAVAELQGGGVTLTFARPGTYVLKDVLAARQRTSRGVAAALATTMQRIAGHVPTASSTGGTRGADQDETESDPWVLGESDTYRKAGISALRSGDPDRAMQQLALARNVAEPGEVPEIRYWTGVALSDAGRVSEALRELADLVPGPDAAWTADFVLLKASLLQGANAYAEAGEWLAAHNLAKDAARAQAWYFLLGSSLRETGNDAAAREALTKARTLDPGSELGRAAADLLAAS
jgi:tetratricopeptide (TPR) repeat protein